MSLRYTLCKHTILVYDTNIAWNITFNTAMMQYFNDVIRYIAYKL